MAGLRERARSRRDALDLLIVRISCLLLSCYYGRLGRAAAWGGKWLMGLEIELV